MYSSDKPISVKETGGEDKSIIEHLEELRETLIKCFLSIAFVMPFAFYFSPKVLNFLTASLTQNRQLYYFAPMEVFLLQLKLALLISLTVSFPYIAKQLWDFILPALYDNEKKFIKKIVISSSVLFASGVIFCLAVILPFIMNFALSFSEGNTQALLGISNVVNLALNLAFVFGLMFQIPIITHLLIKWGIVSYETAASKRRYAVIILLAAAALLTPPDIISQILLFAPSYMLFELGLILSRKEKNKK